MIKRLGNVWNERKVDAMVIGGDRSGTRWLRSLCEQHPDIYFCPVSQKEYLPKGEVLKRRFLGRMKFNCPTDEYQGQTTVLGMRNMKRYHPDKVARMYFSHNRNMKFILSIRNPIDRTFSQYVSRMDSRIKQKVELRTTFDINEELGVEQSHVRSSRVYTMLKPYLDLFPREQFFIYPMVLFKQDTERWLKKVFAFLGVQQDVPIDYTQLDVNPGKYDAATFVPMSADSKRYLVTLFMEETKAMSELCGVDLVELWGFKNHLQETSPTTST